jgi:hypothetical protein
VWLEVSLSIGAARIEQPKLTLCLPLYLRVRAHVSTPLISRTSYEMFRFEFRRAAGSINVTADANGTYSATLDLGSLEAPPAAGSSVLFEATWIGPTRERLTASATTKVQYSEHVVTVSTSLLGEHRIPGREFSIVPTVEPDEIPAGSSVKVCSL